MTVGLPLHSDWLPTMHQRSYTVSSIHLLDILRTEPCIPRSKQSIYYSRSAEMYNIFVGCVDEILEGCVHGEPTYQFPVCRNILIKATYSTNPCFEDPVYILRKQLNLNIGLLLMCFVQSFIQQLLLNIYFVAGTVPRIYQWQRSLLSEFPSI